MSCPPLPAERHSLWAVCYMQYYTFLYKLKILPEENFVYLSDHIEFNLHIYWIILAILSLKMTYV